MGDETMSTTCIDVSLLGQGQQVDGGKPKSRILLARICRLTSYDSARDQQNCDNQTKVILYNSQLNSVTVDYVGLQYVTALLTRIEQQTASYLIDQYTVVRTRRGKGE